MLRMYYTLRHSPQIVNHRRAVRHTVHRKMLHTHQFGSRVVQRLRGNRCACTQSEKRWWNSLPSVGSPMTLSLRLHFVRLLNASIKIAAAPRLLSSPEASQPISNAFLYCFVFRYFFFFFLFFNLCKLSLCTSRLFTWYICYFHFELVDSNSVKSREKIAIIQ